MPNHVAELIESGWPEEPPVVSNLIKAGARPRSLKEARDVLELRGHAGRKRAKRILPIKVRN